MKLFLIITALAVILLEATVILALILTRTGEKKENVPQVSFMELAKRRYSVRKYSDKVVPRELLEKILETGNIAPTAMNFQPQRIHVLQEPQMLAKLDTLTHCRYGAPIVLVFTYNENEDWKNPKEDGVHSGVEDVSIVATHIMLQATELGVSTTWCNFFANSELEKVLDLPESERSVLIMPVGYPADGVEPSSRHFEKKPLESTVSWE